MLARSRSVVEAALANDAFVQLIRFAIAGVGVTLFAATIYLAAATALHVPPLIANTISTCCGVVVGYLVHSRWSFRGADEEAGVEAAQALKFLCAAGAAFALNSFWVWLAVHGLRLPTWTPVTGMVFVTPLASFAVNRWWVFAAPAASA